MKKKASKTRPASRKAPVRKAATAKKTRPAKKAVPRAPPRKLAAFSQKMIREEDAPVAVRSWSEAKTGSLGHQELLPKTGQVQQTGSAPAPMADPRLDPLTGPMAVPKPRNESFVFASAKRAKKGKGEKPEEFGQVELRQATASGGRHLTKAKPENLQRGASRIQPLASSDSRSSRPSKPESFKPASGTPKGPSPESLLDFGEIEIGQQTRSGSKKLGRLDREKDE